MIRSEFTRRMIEHIRAAGQADTRELARVAGLPTGEISCRLGHHVRNGTLRLLRTGRKGGEASLYEFCNGEKMKVQRPRAVVSGVCVCGRPAVVLKTNAKVCAVCAAAEARNDRAGLMLADRVRMFGSDRSLDKYREQSFHAFGKLAKLARTFSL